MEVFRANLQLLEEQQMYPPAEVAVPGRLDDPKDGLPVMLMKCAGGQKVEAPKLPHGGPALVAGKRRDLQRIGVKHTDALT